MSVLGGFFDLPAPEFLSTGSSDRALHARSELDPVYSDMESFFTLPSISEEAILSSSATVEPSSEKFQDSCEGPEDLRNIAETLAGVICRVVTPNGDGSGCLLKGNLLLTNHHVIDSKETAEKSYVVFCRVTARDRSTRLVDFQRSPRIRLDHRAFHVFSKAPPVGFVATQDALDYVVIGLKEHSYVGFVNHWAFSIIHTSNPIGNSRVCILQYPDIEVPEENDEDPVKGVVKWTAGVFSKVVKECSIHYSPITAPGSSGGAALNENRELVALHYQGEIPCEICTSSLSTCRGGVLISKIKEDLIAQGQYEELIRRAEQPLSYSPFKEVYRQRNWFSLLIEQEREISIERALPPLLLEDINEENSCEELDSSQPVKLEELFEHESLVEAEIKRIMIYGSTGVGKSLLCQSIANRWSQGSLWPRLVHVVWIRLRNLNQNNFPPNRSYNVWDIVARESQLDVEVVKRFMREPGFKQHALLLLDGEDEVPKEIVNSYLSSVFHKLTNSFCQILVTSRFKESAIVPKAGLTLEVKEFDEKRIYEYTNMVFRGEDDSKAILHDQLKNPQVKSLARIPINLEIFCSLIRKGKALFPSGKKPTKTALYKTVVDWHYARFLIERRSFDSSEIVEDIESFAPDNDPEINRLSFILEEIAWMSFEKGEQQLSKQRILDICRKYGYRDLKPLKSLGLFQIKGKIGFFIHPSFQEYFVASYFAHLHMSEKKELAGEILKVYYYSKHYKSVWPLVAGYLSLHKHSVSLRDFFDALLEDPCELDGCLTLSLLGRCFEECQNLSSIGKHYNVYKQSVISVIKKGSILYRCYSHIFKSYSKMIYDRQVLRAVNEKIQGGSPYIKYDLVTRVTQKGKNIPDELFLPIERLVLSPSKAFYEKDLAAQLLVDIAKAGGEFSMRALESLCQSFSNDENDQGFRIFVKRGFKEIVESDLLSPEQLQEVLIRLTSNPYKGVREISINFLRKVIESEGGLGEKAQELLIQLASDSSYGVRKAALRTLVWIIRSGRGHSGKALESLNMLASDPSDDIRFMAGSELTLVNAKK